VRRVGRGRGHIFVTKLALVTGATSGIGHAYAEPVAAQSYDVIAIGRSQDRLQQLAKTLSAVTRPPCQRTSRPTRACAPSLSSAPQTRVTCSSTMPGSRT
jgi:3-hydroxy acid dehydrogenase / malonic semialdehyde reductase